MILKFPQKVGLRPVNVPSRKKSGVRLRVVDRRNADLVRAQVQFAISRAAGFRALKGWTNETAQAGDWHYLDVKPELVARFLRNVARSVRRGSVELRLNGKQVRLAA